MDYKKALAEHPTAKEVHVNENGEFLFCPAKGVHASFGEFKTYKKEDGENVESTDNESVEESPKKGKKK